MEWPTQILRATWHQIFFCRVIFCASLLLPHSIDKPPPSWYICPILAQEEPIATWERTIPGQRAWGCSSKVALAVSPRIGSFPRYQAFRFKSFIGLEESLRQRHAEGLLSAARTVPSYLNQPPMSMGQRTSSDHWNRSSLVGILLVWVRWLLETPRRWISVPCVHLPLRVRSIRVHLAVRWCHFWHDSV